MSSNYLVPNPLETDKQYARFHHLDVGSLEDNKLKDELHALRPLLWGLPPNHWLRERVVRIEDELRRRRGDTRYESSRQQKPKLAKGVQL